ncbi:MAG TPA: M56 family metallopeptidase, partial [bacterium]|nr:M56 family metallopeptidase [bacterium]
MIPSSALFSTPLIRALGWALLHSLWQGAAVVAVLFPLLWALRKQTPNTRYVVLCIALILILVLAAGAFYECLPGISASRLIVESTHVSSVSSVPQTGVKAALAVSESRLQQTGEGERVALAFSKDLARPQQFTAPYLLELALPWLGLFWLTGVAVLSLRLVWGWRQMRSLTRRSVRPVAKTMDDILRRLCRQIRVSQTVHLIESALVEVPTVVGWLRPVILLPASVFTGLTQQQL